MSSTEHVNQRMHVTSRKTTVMSSEYTHIDGAAGEKKGRFCSTSAADDKECCMIMLLVKVLVCILCGMTFGVALHKAHGM